MLSPLPQLVTFAEGKRHLREDEPSTSPPSELDLEIESKIEQATGVVLDYLKYPDVAANWDETTVPPAVKAATLVVLSNLFDHPEDDAISMNVQNLLRRFRDPALA